MPLYDYKCPSCKHLWEKLELKRGLPPAPCPKCDVEGVRQLSSASFRLYGEGFTKRTHKDTGDFGD
jgi:putative FmdB family regulatory protein